jgi:hypothetical protein
VASIKVPTWYEVWAVELSLGPEKRELWITRDIAEAIEVARNFVGGPDYRELEVRECWTLHGWDKQWKVVWTEAGGNAS